MHALLLLSAFCSGDLLAQISQKFYGNHQPREMGIVKLESESTLSLFGRDRKIVQTLYIDTQKPYYLKHFTSAGSTSQYGFDGQKTWVLPASKPPIAVKGALKDWLEHPLIYLHHPDVHLQETTHPKAESNQRVVKATYVVAGQEEALSLLFFNAQTFELEASIDLRAGTERGFTRYSEYQSFDGLWLPSLVTQDDSLDKAERLISVAVKQPEPEGWQAP